MCKKDLSIYTGLTTATMAYKQGTSKTSMIPYNEVMKA